MEEINSAIKKKLILNCDYLKFTYLISVCSHSGLCLYLWILIRIYGSRQKDVKESYTVVDSVSFKVDGMAVQHTRPYLRICLLSEGFLDGTSPGPHEVCGIKFSFSVSTGKSENQYVLQV